MVIPQVARVFWTPWVVEDGKVVSAGPTSPKSDPLVLIEVWDNWGARLLDQAIADAISES